MRELVDMVSASQCKRQADLCTAEAHCEADIMIQAALHSMADQWLTLEKQIEWISETRVRAVTKEEEVDLTLVETPLS